MILREERIMNHHFSSYYDLDRKMREQEVKRASENRYWLDQVQDRKQKLRRTPRWRTFVVMMSGFFV